MDLPPVPLPLVKSPPCLFGAKNDTVETCACVSKTVLASSDFTKVPCSFRNYVIVELEDDPMTRCIFCNFIFCWGDSYIELKNKILRLDSLKQEMKNVQKLMPWLTRDNRWRDAAWSSTSVNLQISHETPDFTVRWGALACIAWHATLPASSAWHALLWWNLVKANRFHY